ncbi:MAG TPA: hypothetical protein PLW77_00240 [Bacteroidales bacterium]|nr:hypothetical protein [Bacteroidales bacterium]
MKVVFKILLIISFFCQINNLNAKEITNTGEDIDYIAELFIQIENEKTDTKKIEINQHLIEYLESFLAKSESFSADYSKIKKLSVLMSDDKLLKIYTWNLAFQNGSSKYFGFLQYKPSGKINLFFLNDKNYNSENDTDPRLYQSNTEWYGVIYYEIVTKKWNSKTYYTLLGYDAADFLINRKVVETLYFDRKDLPIFGKKMFKINRTQTGRLIFEYADRVTMLLRYNKKQDMIVLDHLVPPEPKYNNMYQFYGPDFSYDALVFKGGKWILETNIDPDIAINYKKDQKINHIKRKGASKNF